MSSSSEDSDYDEPPAKRIRDNVRGYYNIQPRSKRKSRKFNTSGNVYDVSFKSFNEPFEFTHRLFNNMVEDLYDEADVGDDDKVRISITHPDLEFGIHIPFDNAAQISGQTLLNEIERVSQSNDKFKIHDGHIQVEMTHVDMPQGSGRQKMSFGSHVSIDNMTKVKTSIVKIDNAHDSMCLARSIVVGKCKADRTNDPAWDRRWHLIRQSSKSLQRQEAMKLLDGVGIRYDQACGVDEYKKIQESLYPNYVIKVWPQFEKMEVLFDYPPLTKESKVIHIYHHDGHYDCITSITGFLGCSYFCEHCNYGYNYREAHWCKNICVCYSPTPCPREGYYPCQDCDRVFRSQECFERHKMKNGKVKKTICELVYACKNCNKLIRERKKHHLCPGTTKCKYCQKIVGPNHECFIPVYTAPEKKKSKVPFIFFDFECRFDSGEHIPNFCVAQRACGDCMCQSVKEYCRYCQTIDEGKEVVFRGDNTLQEFCTWLFQPQHKGSTVIAHNAQGYDAQFILRHLLTNGTTKPELIMNGSKIIMMKAHGVRFIDSLSFLAMPLSDFPKTFGLTELAKGWFPFYANTHANQNYVGPYLPVSCYRPDSMKPENRVKFMAWYNERVKKNDVFDFQQEMEKYCKSDVDILRRGCGEFRQQLLESDQIDPFMEATTLAQVCNKAWRKNSMPPQSLAVISDAGYPNKTRYSMKGIRWIQGISMKEGKKIQHALNGGEVQLGPYFLDGFHRETNTVFEFMGCWCHGCPKCYTVRDKIHPYTLRTMEDLYMDTQSRLNDLQTQGMKTVVIWECDFDNKCRTDPEYKDLINRFYPHQDPIQPREALFGGRTNAVKLYHEVDENTNEEIKYADICSLYPFVNKHREYPLGHPEILSQEQINVSNIGQYKGLIKCRVLPPDDLWLPVLPIHCNKKMVFTLCRTCAEEECQQCHHTFYKRCLTGTWTSVELAKAIELGYKVLDIYHVWHWESWSSNVYRNYIDKYLKLKQEASGYPDYVESKEDQKRFKQAYFLAEGIKLEHVEKNKGKRAFAKTMLNCLWGKNAQTNVMSKTEYVTALKRFYDLLSDGNITVQNAEFFDHDHFMLMNYKDDSDKTHPHSSSNPVVASFVTAYARLELYKQLEQLGDRVLYFDTDSCMYIYDPEKYNIPIEDSRLGKWTDEVPNGRIVKFVALGPKNYGYEYIEKGERFQKCKVKGITIDYNASQKVNFKSMVDCVQDRDNYSTVVEYESRIKRHRDRKVTSERQTKTFRSVYTKRVVSGYKTVPFGYRPS